MEFPGPHAGRRFMEPLLVTFLSPDPSQLTEKMSFLVVLVLLANVILLPKIPLVPV